MRHVIRRLAARVTDSVSSVFPRRAPGRHSAVYLAARQTVAAVPAPAAAGGRGECAPFTVRPYVLAHEERVRRRRRRGSLTVLPAGLYLSAGVVAR
jgi:hypothetical protein